MQAQRDYSAPYSSNVVSFDFVSKKRVSSSLREHTNNGVLRRGQSQEVYPLKNQEHIDAMGLHLLAPGTKYAMRNFLFFALGINMGFRGGDLCQLKWGQILGMDGEIINSEYNAITEQKTNKSRILVYNHNAKKAIAFYLKHTKATPDPDDYVFPSRQGNTHVARDSFRQIIKEAATACGIPFNVGTHSLRKTFGYQFYKSTGDIGTLQLILNHSSPMQTLTYIGITAETIQAGYDRIRNNMQVLDQFD